VGRIRRPKQGPTAEATWIALNYWNEVQDKSEDSRVPMLCYDLRRPFHGCGTLSITKTVSRFCVCIACVNTKKSNVSPPAPQHCPKFRLSSTRNERLQKAHCCTRVHTFCYFLSWKLLTPQRDCELFRYDGRHAAPEVTSVSSARFPGPSVHKADIIPQAGLTTHSDIVTYLRDVD